MGTELEDDTFDEFSWISDVAPCISVSGGSVQIISHPKEFYQTLKRLILESKKRVVLSSLYLGNGQLEQDLVAALQEALGKNGSEYKMRILLDYCRGTRGKFNSSSLLQPLVSDATNAGKDAKVNFYHTQNLRGILKRLLPERLNEIVGLQHMKLYIIDDTLLISGANLSDSYFTDRQDRCIMIENCSKLTDFYHQIVEAVGSCSFELLDNGSLVPDSRCSVHPYLGDKTGYSNLLRDRVMKIVESFKNETFLCSNQDTRIYPLVQMGPAQIDIENFVIRKSLAIAPSDRTLSLASGYLNLTSEYSDVILNGAHYRVRALTACPMANSFFNASGISYYVPALYSAVARMFYEQVNANKQTDRIEMFEFERLGWTFHAKGLWWSTNEPTNKTYATFVGSSNFGYRSVHRDLEAQMVIVTKNSALQRQLFEEQQNLFKYGKLIEAKTFEMPEHYAPYWLRILARFIRNFF